MKRLLNLLWAFCFLFPLSVFGATGVVATDTQDHPFTLKDLHGKWVYVNYWAYFCHPCREEIPALNKFYQTHKDKVVVVGVNLDNSSFRETLQQAKGLHITYPLSNSNSGAIFHVDDNSVTGTPTTYVINPEGKLVNTLYGSQTVSSLTEAMQ